MDRGTLIDLYLEAVTECRALARAERLAELRGKYVPKYDTQNLHSFSFAWGRVVALRDLMDPADADALYVAPWVLKKESREQALDTFRDELLGISGESGRDG
jgi:hypothetical protein